MGKINLYLDSNIWLNLYHFSNDNLEEFEKLKYAEVNIYLPKQTKDEVNRNRNNKINDAIKKFDVKKFKSPQIPNIFKEYKDEYKAFNDKIEKIERIITDWHNKVDNDIKNRELAADQVIDELFESAIFIESDNYYEEAVKRMNIGNPPGKNNSYGDALNWLSLLYETEENKEFIFITEDMDYYNDFKNNVPNDFLLDEWRREKNSKITFYTNLKEFFSKYLPNIRLDDEIDKEKLIESLSDSSNFTTTHLIIAELSEYDYFNKEQKLELLKIAYINNQVNWILNDHDVEDFYINLYPDILKSPLKLEDFSKIEGAEWVSF